MFSEKCKQKDVYSVAILRHTIRKEGLEILTLRAREESGFNESFFFLFTTSKAVMPLSGKGLLEVEQNEKTFLNRNDNKRTRSTETEDDD